MNYKIKALRALVGKRQVDLSQETGIPQSKISLIEGGLTRIREDEKIAIAQALRCKPEELFPTR